MSANYVLSFDALRQGLDGIDGYILVLDTYGINVWCAAGKGSFGTDELVERIKKTSLLDEVETRRIMVPQLGATGVCAHDVKKRSGFKVDFGLVRAEDIPEFIRNGKATEEMRTVRYDISDKAVLIPVEGKQGIPLAGNLAMLAAYLGDGSIAALGIGSAAAAGLVAFPLLMPWVPGKDFSTKGFVLGGAVALRDGCCYPPQGRRDQPRLAACEGGVLPARVPGAHVLHRTQLDGGFDFHLPTGVRKEISTYVPVMAVMGASGIIANVAQRLLRSRKG